MKLPFVGRRKKARARVLGLVPLVPKLLRLLYRLFRDARVSRLHKGLVASAIAYVIIPVDLLPDFFGLIGWVDDLFLVGLTLNRLLRQTSDAVLLEHWDGAPDTLRALLGRVDEVGSVLPRRTRRVLRRLVGGR